MFYFPQHLEVLHNLSRMPGRIVGSAITEKGWHILRRVDYPGGAWRVFHHVYHPTTAQPLESWSSQYTFGNAAPRSMTFRAKQARKAAPSPRKAAKVS